MESVDPRLLGAAFLFVFVASMVSERLLVSVVGHGDMPQIMVRVSRRVGRMRISNLVALLNSAGIIVLAVLLYAAFREQFRVLSLLVLGWRLAEALTLAMSKVGTYSLVPLSQAYVKAGASDSSQLPALGRTLYHGLDRTGYDFHMLFFCLGAIVWCYLFLASGAIPRWLSI